MIFFFTTDNLSNCIDFKKYTGLELSLVKKDIQGKKVLVIKNVYNNKNIIIFAGENEKELVGTIRNY